MTPTINYDTENEALLQRAIDAAPSPGPAVTALLGHALTVLRNFPGIVRSASFRRLCMGSAAMAVANGLDRDDPVLYGCRESSYEAEAFTCSCGGRLRILDERDGARATECERCGAERMEDTTR